MMKEAPRGRNDVDLLAGAADFQPIERLHGAVRLALRRAERREVVTSDQVRCRFLHRIDVERNSDMPYPAVVQCGRSAAVEHTIEVTPADTGETGVPVV